jgi:hypothetical protein
MGDAGRASSIRRVTSGARRLRITAGDVRKHPGAGRDVSVFFNVRSDARTTLSMATVQAVFRDRTGKIVGGLDQDLGGPATF